MSGQEERASVVSTLPDAMLPLAAVMRLAEDADHRFIPFGLYSEGASDQVVSLIYTASDGRIITVGYSPETSEWQRIEAHPPGATVGETIDLSVEWLREEFSDDAREHLEYLDIARIFNEFLDGQEGDAS